MRDLIKEAKKNLRKSILAARDTLTKEEIATYSEVIFDTLTGLPQYQSSRFIMAYVDFKNEVSTRVFIKKCLASNRRVAVPMVVDEGEGRKGLWACEIQDMEEDLEVGTYGILEPKKGKIRRIDPKLLDLLVVPGVVFDQQKNRVGYGAGFYDRFLKTVGNQCSKVGVAFELQVVKNVPVEEHDIPLDIIITENRII